MNTELWNSILQFDFDNPPSEYGFSIRLANENYWTKSFTEQAITEYKKFMYLAATSDFMVSPSEIVDVVWHQHLIFTQSYEDFCVILGKRIQHIPSTHSKAEFEKFKQAKERTKKLYAENFGEQPNNIWNYSDMYESLHLPKAKFKIRTFIICGILAFVSLIVPAYFLLKPVYVTIDNPYFITGFFILIVLTFSALEIFNRIRLKQITNQFAKDSFVYNLQPYELVYLKTQKLTDVINGTINELIVNGAIIINSDNTFEMSGTGTAKTIEQLQVMNVLHDSGKINYQTFLKQLITKPVFRNIANSMNAFKKYFNKSKKFGSLFYTNFWILAILLMLGLIRLTTGILRDKPVIQISAAIIALMILIIIYLNRLTNLVCTFTIPVLYKRKILPDKQTEEDWQWSYFLLGTSVLAASFIPVLKYRDNSDNYSSGVSSCGSSCGSSCSSCGGCGGGD